MMGAAYPANQCRWGWGRLQRRTDPVVQTELAGMATCTELTITVRHGHPAGGNIQVCECSNYLAHFGRAKCPFPHLPRRVMKLNGGYTALFRAVDTQQFLL